MINYVKNGSPKGDASSALLASAKQFWTERFASIGKMSGSENPYQIGYEMGDLMIKAATVVKKNSELDAALVTIKQLKERWTAVNALDSGRTLNQAVSYTNQLWNMLELAELMLKASRLRDECRGSHYKPEFNLPEPKTHDPTQDPVWMAAWQKRNDTWLKSSMGRYDKEGPKVTFEPLRSLTQETPILRPEPRWYG